MNQQNCFNQALKLERVILLKRCFCKTHLFCSQRSRYSKKRLLYKIYTLANELHHNPAVMEALLIPLITTTDDHSPLNWQNGFEKVKGFCYQLLTTLLLLLVVYRVTLTITNRRRDPNSYNGVKFKLLPFTSLCHSYIINDIRNLYLLFQLKCNNTLQYYCPLKAHNFTTFVYVAL